MSAGRARPASGVHGRQPEGSTARRRAGPPPRPWPRPRGSPGLPTRIDLGRRRPRWRGRARLSRCPAGTTRTTHSGSRQRAARDPLRPHTWHARAVRPTARADCAPRGTARRIAAGTAGSRVSHRAPASAPAADPAPARSLPCRLGSRRRGRHGLRHSRRVSHRLLRQRLELDHSSLSSDVAHVSTPLHRLAGRPSSRTAREPNRPTRSMLGTSPALVEIRGGPAPGNAWREAEGHTSSPSTRSLARPPSGKTSSRTCVTTSVVETGNW